MNQPEHAEKVLAGGPEEPLAHDERSALLGVQFDGPLAAGLAGPQLSLDSPEDRRLAGPVNLNPLSRNEFHTPIIPSSSNFGSNRTPDHG